MIKTRSNNKILTIVSLLVMLLFAFVPMLAVKPAEVYAASWSMEAKVQENVIHVTIHGPEDTASAPTVIPEVKEGEGTAAAGDVSGSAGEYSVDITLTNVKEIGSVKITVTNGGSGDTLITYVTKTVTINIDKLDWYNGTFGKIIDLMGKILVPLLVLVGTAGSIYAVVLGVNYSKAEDASKREEAKKRLIGAVVGIGIMLALLLVLFLFTKFAPQIVASIRSNG